MEKQRVSSSTVMSIGYDRQTETLEIEFGSGRVYQYYGVPDNLHNEIMQTPSKGQFFKYLHQGSISVFTGGVTGG